MNTSTRLKSLNAEVEDANIPLQDTTSHDELDEIETFQEIDKEHSEQVLVAVEADEDDFRSDDEGEEDMQLDTLSDRKVVKDKMEKGNKQESELEPDSSDSFFNMEGDSDSEIQFGATRDSNNLMTTRDSIPGLMVEEIVAK